MTQRKIDIGAVLSRVFEIYGKTAGTVIPAALVLFIPVALLGAIFDESAGGQLLANMVSIVASLWFAGIVVKAVQDVHEDGRLDASAGELFGSVTHVLFPLFLVGLVAGIAVVFGLLLFIIPGLILITIWAVAAPVVVLENPGVFKALGRSRELVKGNGWQVFGVLVAIFAIVIVASIVIGSIAAIGDTFILTFLVTLLLMLALAPIQALVQAVLYFALREAHGSPALTSSMEVFGAGAAGGGFAAPSAPPIAEPSAAPPAAPPPSGPVPPAPGEGGTDPFGNLMPPKPPEGGSTPPPSQPPPGAA
ncbi:MAG: hypothetical protein MUC84_07950 [Solirubrobacteraceae bacterium]|nr:hypothetical protein [Solirubrobacteraceae bacterium]